MITVNSRRVAREVALTVGATFGVLCVTLALAAPLLGIRLLVFKSGSMGPEINTGALAIARTIDASRVEVGDVVSVTTAEGTRVTHRVTRVIPDGDQVQLELKGDANAQPDTETYPVTEVDQVVAHVNGMGYLVDALASPYAIFLAGAGAAGLLVLAFRRRSSDGQDRATSPVVAEPSEANLLRSTDSPADTHPREQAPAELSTLGEESSVEQDHVDQESIIGSGLAPVVRRNGGRATAIAALTVPLLCTGTVAWGIIGGGSILPTLASFSDSAGVTAPVSTMEVPAPSGSIGCVNGAPFSGAVHLDWPAVADAPVGYRYRVEVYLNDPASPVKTYTSTEPAVEVFRGDIPTSDTYQVRISGEVEGSTWHSSEGITRPVWSGGFGWEINCS